MNAMTLVRIHPGLYISVETASILLLHSKAVPEKINSQNLTVYEYQLLANQRKDINVWQLVLMSKLDSNISFKVYFVLVKTNITSHYMYLSQFTTG